MAISNDSIQKLLLLLRPYLRNESERRAYLMRALGTNADALNLIWNEPVNTFIPNMVQALVAFGEVTPDQPALCALLEVIREDVGVDTQDSIDKLLQQIREELQKAQIASNSLPTTDALIEQVEQYLSDPNRSVGSWKCAYTLKGHSGEVESVVISPDGRTLASGSSDTTIKLWELRSGKELHSMKGHSTIVRSLAFSPDGKTLVSSSNVDAADGNIKLWDVATSRLKRTLGGGLSSFRVNCLAFSPDGKTLASGHINTVKLWDLDTGKERETLWGHAIDVNSVVFSADGQFLVAGCSQGEIKIWDWRKRNLLRTLNQAENIIGSMVSWLNPSRMLWSIAISPDGQTIASSGYGQPITLWKFDTGTMLRTLTQHSCGVHVVIFSPDEKIIASGGADKTIRIWSVRTGDLLYIIEHLGVVNCLAFSPDGKTLVSGGEDKTIKVWHIDS